MSSVSGGFALDHAGGLPSARPSPPHLPTLRKKILRAPVSISTKHGKIADNIRYPLYGAVKAGRKARLAVVAGRISADVDGHGQVELGEMTG